MLPTTNLIKKFIFLMLISFLSLFSSCNSAENLGDLLDLVIDPPERESIDTSRLGLNNFFVDPEFGNITQQYAEIQNTLGVNSLRVLVAWVNEVQPTPNSTPDFGFFDNIINNIPPGMDVTVVVFGTPDWMANPANWIDNNPRLTWVNLWLNTVTARYGSVPGVIGFEIFNEPDFVELSSDAALGLTDPANYMEMVRLGAPVVRNNAPGKLVIPAATLSINQNFPNNFNYNIALRDMGMASLVDVWNIHYYSQSFERVIQDGGIADFLNGLGMPIWMTESGEMGPLNQLEYAEVTWPFLRNEIPALDRIYYFQYGEVIPSDVSFGLRTLDGVSDLFVHLQERAGG